MAYQTTSFQMTQSNLKDHSTVAGFFKRDLHSCTAVDNTQGLARRAVPLRQLSHLYLSSLLDLSSYAEVINQLSVSNLICNGQSDLCALN